MRVLVVYGSHGGGTRGIARTVRLNLELAGHTAKVHAAHEVDALEGFDAVVVGGALYATLWHPEARRFVQRHAEQLRTLPVYFFSSGPLDDSATARVIPPTRSVRRLMKLVSARAHATFGGRLDRTAEGFMARQMVRGGMAGDFRDIRQIDAWSDFVAAGLATQPKRAPAPGAWAKRRHVRQVAAMLSLFTGLTALLGGLELVWWSQGAPWLPPLSLLATTPFDNFLVPGLLLLGSVGTTSLLAGSMLVRRHALEQRALMVAGLALCVWIITEMVLLHMTHWLQLFYLAIGVATLLMGLWLEFEPSRKATPPGTAHRLRTT